MTSYDERLWRIKSLLCKACCVHICSTNAGQRPEKCANTVNATNVIPELLQIPTLPTRILVHHAPAPHDRLAHAHELQSLGPEIILSSASRFSWACRRRDGCRTGRRTAGVKCRIEWLPFAGGVLRSGLKKRVPTVHNIHHPCAEPTPSSTHKKLLRKSFSSCGMLVSVLLPCY